MHHHSHWASFTWLDPVNAREQASLVGDRLAILVGSDGDVGTRRTALEGKLDELVGIARRIRSLDPPTMIASEPEYQYLASGCGIEILDADWHWNEPAPHDGMESLRNLVSASNANLILVPSEPDAERLSLIHI